MAHALTTAVRGKESGVKQRVGVYELLAAVKLVGIVSPAMHDGPCV